MDGDASVEPALDAFSLTLPLPYRVALITVLATWGWGANLHYLYLQKIDVPSLIRYPGRPTAAHLPHHHSAYRLATVTSSVLAASLLIFWAYTRHDVDRVLALDWLPMTTLSVLGLLLILPFPLNFIKRHNRRRLSDPTAANGGTTNSSGSPPPWALPQDGRRRFAATLRRVAVGGLAEAQHGKFGDILLADVLTSYSKVLGDLYVCICMFFFTSSRAGAPSEPSATDRPDRNCGGGVIVPLIMVMPFLARFRQCLIEYLRVRRAIRDRPFDPAVGWGGQHLANAAKYATSFPVILFSALQRNAKAAEDTGTTTMAVSTTYYRLWVLAVAVNSLYSFYWDVAKDWDLTLFDGARARNAPDHPWALRRRLLINRGQPLTYYAAIALDFVLRCTWSLKLSPHLDHVADFESSLFLMQLLEVMRRWVWIFFRVETEWIRSTNSNAMPDFSQGLLGGGGFGSGSRSASASSSTSGGGIMLGDYTPKYDDSDSDDDI
ncbi:protein-ER retention protein [Sporothrix curviconia]|uniref:Protein-ER retention protein n=1 Tax=Sporothrix curviconia TaxID=1260050 RepID=A0ABP0C084_9PEZI